MPMVIPAASGGAGPGSGLDIRDRTHSLRVYPQCFVGSEAVAWMIRERVAVNEVLSSVPLSYRSPSLTTMPCARVTATVSPMRFGLAIG